MDIRKLQRAIVDGLEDVKAQDIQVFNTEHLSPLFERVIIASGTSNRQTKALAASVRDAVKSGGMAVMRTEGEENGEWIIVDCGAAVCHIMQPTIRQYYHLEEIWGGKPVKIKLGETRGLVKASEPIEVDAEDEEANASPKPRKAARTGGDATAPAKKAAAKKPAAKKAAAKKAPARGAAGERAARGAPARTAAAPAPTRAPAAKKVAKKAASKASSGAASGGGKAPARKTASASGAAARPSGRTAAGKAAAGTSPARKTVARKAPAAKTSTGKAPASKTAAGKTPAGKKTAARKTAR